MAVESDPSLKTACFPRHQIGGHAAEGNGEIVKRLHARISQSFPVDQKADLLAGIQSSGQHQASPQTQHNRVGERDLVFFSSERQVFIRNGSAQDDIPILLFNQLAKLLRTLAGGVESAHQAAHAGAREIVDGNVMVFKPLQHSDVRQSERSAAFERHANFQPGPGGRRWRGRI